MVFHNNDRGVDIKILGLALWKFIVLTSGACLFKELLPKSIPCGHEEGVASSPFKKPVETGKFHSHPLKE